jgi:hypothetical protein
MLFTVFFSYLFLFIHLLLGLGELSRQVVAVVSQWWVGYSLARRPVVLLSTAGGVVTYAGSPSQLLG